LNSTPGNEIMQLNETMKSMLAEIARMKSLSEELEIANTSLVKASESIRDTSGSVSEAAAGMTTITHELVALDPNGLRKQVDEQGAKIVAGLNAKIKMLAILVGISIALSGGILAFLVFGK